MEHKCCPGCEEPVIDKLPGCPLQCRTVQCMAYKKKPVYDFEILPIIWVIGGPGSGKDALCKNISDTYKFTAISVGAMLRAEVEACTDRTKCLKSVMARGGFPPNDLVLELIIKAVEENAAKGSIGFVINGFPREKSQGALFERALGRPSLILYLEATTEKLFNTMKTRPKNPQRLDETPIAMRLRLETFMKHNDNIIELYKYTLVKVNGNEAPATVFTEASKIISPMLERVEALKIEKAKKKPAQPIPAPSQPAPSQPVPAPPQPAKKP